MALPQQKDVEIPLLLEIEKAGGQARPNGLYPAIKTHFPHITEDDQAEVHLFGSNKWINHIQWTRQALIDKGELDGSVRGVWKITDAGRRRLCAYRSGEPYEPVPKAATPGDSVSQSQVASATPDTLPDILSLERIIIEVLSERPNQTCKKDAILPLSLKRIRPGSWGKPKEIWLSELRKAFRRLRGVGIIREYKATNQRVRLVTDYEARWEKHSRRVAGLRKPVNIKAQPYSYQTDSSPTDDEESIAYTEDILGPTDLPELPDETTFDDGWVTKCMTPLKQIQSLKRWGWEVSQ